MTDTVIRLEGFAAPLKGQRLWVCGPAATLGQQIQARLTVLEEELLGRGRKVLLVQNARDIPMLWSNKVQWDATFRIKETQDLRLALTYIQNAIKPVRVVWVGDEPPLALLTALTSPEITFIGAGTITPRLQWSAIFWHTTTEQSKIEEGLGPRIGIAALQAMNLSPILRELKASQVGLVWSSIGEADKKGTAYWYDAEEAAPVTTMEPKEMSALLHEIGDWMIHARY
jgi:hypothetical protein